MDEHSASEIISSSSEFLDVVATSFDELVVGSASFAVAETHLLSLANEVVRRALTRRLQRIADQCGDDFVLKGARFRKHLPGDVEYHSLCGTIEITRYSYRQVGVHNGPTIVPLDIQAGLIENATPALAFSSAHGYARMTTRDYEDEMRAAHRDVPSRSTLERMGKSIGMVAKGLLPTCESELQLAEPLPAGIASISIGIDRTSVPMHEDLPVGRVSSSSRKRSKPHVRTPPPPFEVAYRMGYVGTVTAHDCDGRSIRTWRFAATAAERGEELIDRILSQTHHLMLGHQVPLVVVQDGAPELWRLVHEACERWHIKPTYQIIDRFHLNERLAKVLDILIPNRHERYSLLERWSEWLNTSDRAIDRIVRFLQRELHGCTAMDPRFAPTRMPRGCRYARSLGTKFFAEVADHVGYIEGNRRRFRYASLLALHLPIGSGATEGACKSVFGTRFKRSGARWREEGLSACLTLRTLHLSERLRPMWTKIQSYYSAAA